MNNARFLTCLLPISMLFGVSVALAATDKTPLNDTGADWCGTDKAIKLDCPQPAFPSQDAEFGRDTLAKAGKLKKSGAGQAGFDFTKLNGKGTSIPADAKQWRCVLDNVTGLMWEVKATDGGLQDKNHTYTWFSNNPRINGGTPGAENGGVCKGSRCDTEGFIKALNKQGLCGHKGWRLPLMEELRSIVNYGRAFPAIDTDYFPNTQSKRYWAIEVWAKRDGGRDAYALDFQGGTGEYALRDNKKVGIRLVRNGR